MSLVVIALPRLAPSRPTQRAGLRPLVLSLICVLGVLALLPRPAYAHPMGNFSINRYSRLTVGMDQVGLLYIVDMAEIPTHAERTAMDADGDGAVSAQEERHYLERMAAALPEQLTLQIDGAAASWTPVARRLTFPPGQAGLPTLRMELA
ncbi:MAG TPA: hypothetical protein VNK95_06500, partial [Caldilineaceae bacterium]|nr:hypothetical protein [Caldilineaceae bacterium]